MKKLTIVATLLAAALTLALAGAPDDNAEQAQKLWTEIRGYDQWIVAPGSNLMMPGQAPHGKFVTIHANDVAAKALAGEGDAMPDGAIFAKDNYDSVKKLTHVTVMAKRSGAWFWAVYNAEGKVERAGALEGCIACHSGARHDMVFTWSQPSQGRSR